MRPLPPALPIATLYAAPAAAGQPVWVDPPSGGAASTPRESAAEAVSARSQGSGELTLTIAFEGRPRFVSESSRVVHCGGPVLGQAGRGA